MARTENIPAHARCAKGWRDVSRFADCQGRAIIVRLDVPKIAQANYELQGYRLNRAVFLPTAQRLGQAVAGEMSADDALEAARGRTWTNR